MPESRQPPEQPLSFFARVWSPHKPYPIWKTRDLINTVHTIVDIILSSQVLEKGALKAKF